MNLIESPSLLITDDDRDLRETLGGLFAERGFRTVLAENGEEALQILSTEDVHLLLVDMHMPRLNGLETIRIVRQEQASLPFILLSAALDEHITAEAERLDAFAVYSKPIRVDTLYRSVSHALKVTYNWPQ